jgi:hypothetical protein
MHGILGINKLPFPRNLVIITPDLLLYSLPPVYPVTNTMMFIRTILLLSLATFSLAVPVAQSDSELPSIKDSVGAFCLSQCTPCIKFD